MSSPLTRRWSNESRSTVTTRGGDIPLAQALRFIFGFWLAVFAVSWLLFGHGFAYLWALLGAL